MATLLVALAPAAWYTCRAATIAKAGTVACIHGELLGAFGYEWLLYYFMNVINIRYWWYMCGVIRYSGSVLSWWSVW